MHPSNSISQTLALLASASGTAQELRHQVVQEFIATSEEIRTALRHQLARDGLTVDGFQALAALQHEPAAATATQVAQRVGTTRALLSHTLNRLELSHLITRERDRGDRRIIWVRLTPAGRTAVEKASLTCSKSICHLVNSFDEPELEDLKNSCNRLSQAATAII